MAAGMMMPMVMPVMVMMTFGRSSPSGRRAVRARPGGHRLKRAWRGQAGKADYRQNPG